MISKSQMFAMYSLEIMVFLKICHIIPFNSCSVDTGPIQINQYYMGHAATMAKLVHTVLML